MIQLVDHFESRDYMYYCLEKNNYISDKEIYQMQDMCQKLDLSSPDNLYDTFVSISSKEMISLHDYVIYFENKPKNEYIEIDQRYKNLFKKIADTLEYMHLYGICLRDITTDNILMKNISDSGLPRLSSVQNSVILAPGALTAGSNFGDVRFKAPEQI